jgi:DNA polymerase
MLSGLQHGALGSFLAMPAHDPPSELAGLARALAREIQRREWHGQGKAEGGETPIDPKTDAGSVRNEQPGVSASEDPSAQQDPTVGLTRNQQAAARATNLTELQREIEACRTCDLCHSRRKTVFAKGDGSSGVTFLTLAPGAAEEASGSPLAGPPGELLDKIITQGMQLSPQKTALVSLVQCRPPSDRAPSQQEVELCSPWYQRQLELLKPRVLVPLGGPCAGSVLGLNPDLQSLRGRIHRPEGPPVVPTHHPRELLKTPAAKAACWEDIQLAMEELDLPGGA